MKDDGIHISMREIYDIIVDTSKRLERLEERIHSYHDVDKKSSDALKAADEALKLSRVLTQQAGWLLKAIVGAAIPLLVSIAVYHLQRIFGGH